MISIIHIVIGLPGSGKSTYAKAFGLPVCDDPKRREDLPPPGFGSFVLTDPNLCRPEALAIACEILKEEHPDHDVKFHFFENDPEKCKVNLAHRIGVPRSDLESVCGGTRFGLANIVDDLSKVYDPVSPIEIWQPELEVIPTPSPQ
jgi:hypothetical protein